MRSAMMLSWMSVVPPPMVTALTARVCLAQWAPLGAPLLATGEPAPSATAPLAPDSAKHSSAIC